MKVRDIMSKGVITVGREESLRQISNIFHENRISGAPVVDNEGKLLGMLSESDIVGAAKPLERKLRLIYPSLSLMSVTFEQSAEEKDLAEVVRELQQMCAEEVMTPDVHVIGPEESIQKAVILMNENQVNRLPVIEGDSLVGIITRADIIHYLAGLNLSVIGQVEGP